MDENWRHLPAPARPIAAAATAAVEAVQRRDAEALDGAVVDLAGQDSARTGLILGAAVRLLLEEGHPDGLDGAAVREVLERNVRTGREWQPVDPDVVLILLAGALGAAAGRPARRAPDPAGADGGPGRDRARPAE